MNLFATVLTYPAPSANYRGESELNRSVIQKVTDGRFDYAIISPESMRNAIREMLAGYDLPCNRERVEPVSGDEKPQLAVRFEEFPDPEKFIDDFFFGYLLAIKGKDVENLRKARGKGFPIKRDSVLRMNMAKALEPYRHNAVFTQSPKLAEGNPWKVGEAEGGTSSALLHRETTVTAFQYPFALNMNDCACNDKGCKHEEPKGGKPTTCKRYWTRKLLQAIGELNEVAGNHARSYYEMAPASIVVRLTESLVAGYATYGFTPDGNFPEVIDGMLHDPPDYPGNEFYMGGKIVKEMDDKTQAGLKDREVKLERDPRKLLAIVANKALGGQ
jgi:CRISPR-associated protein Cst2